MTKSLRTLTHAFGLALFCHGALSAASQTITFDGAGNQILGTAPFSLAAQSTSGLPIVFTTSTPAICRTASGLVTLVSAGICSITASQPGNAGYSAAPSVTRNFNVSVGKPSGTITATPASPIPTGTAPLTGPLFAVAGDFNGDGVSDIAMAISSNSVVVLLGNGSGGFGSPEVIPLTTGIYPIALATGDFNGDGSEDLATANLESSDVTVLLGNGSGGFTEAGTFPCGPAPYSIVTGDFNGDGIQDLATANNAGDSITALLGNGAGGFTEARGSPYAVQGQSPVSIAVGDFNGDGIQDLAVADFSSDDVTVLLGGAGGFTAVQGSPFATGTGPSSLAVGDFNGDGISDIATANVFDDDVTVLLGDGTGAFVEASGSPFPVGASPVSVAVGDFNGDGFTDLVTANNGNTGSANNVTILLGNGAGGFNPILGSLSAAGASSDALIVGDFNGDGIEDLAVANYGSNDLTVLLGGPAPTNSLLTASQSSIPAEQAVALTLNVSHTTGAFAAPTGQVTFSNGGTTMGTAVLAAAPYTFIANSLSDGTHSLTANYAGDERSAASSSNALTILVGLAAQTIAFAPLSAITLPAAAFSLSATASSGLPVSFTSVNTDICTVSSPTLTPVAAGICSITATQPGNSTYATANPVTQSFTIYPAALSQSLPLPTGIANAASASQATPQVVAPGAWVAIYGIGLAGSGVPAASSLPLPQALNGVQISLGGMLLPLLYASGGQVNALVPQGLAPNNSYPLLVITAASQSLPVMLFVKSVQPGIYTVNASGSGPGIIAGASNGQLIASGNPAHVSDYLVIYCTGMGTVAGPHGEPAPADGTATPASPFFYTSAIVSAMIGGVNAPVSFSGLTPNFAGLYQVNVQVPAGVAAGDSVPVTIAAADPQTGETALSNTVTIAVQ